jgi:hypothetical protein
MLRPRLLRPGTGQHRRQPRLAGVLAALAAVTVLVALRPDFSAAAHHLAPPPTLAQVNRSITLAQGYLDGLLKPLPGGQAVQSEFYGLPMRVYFPGYRRWVLLGQGHAGECLTGCSGPTAVIAGPSGRSWESGTVLFATPEVPGALRARVTVNWGASPRHFAVTISQVQLTDPATSAQLWLDNFRLATYQPNRPAPQVTRTFSDRDRAVLRSLRYTIRHATQEAYLYWRARGSTARAARLAAFLAHNYYAPGVDLRAAIFGQAASLPAAMPFTATGPDNAYPDCSHLPPPVPTAYAYTSKVCLIGVNAFLLAGRSDPFLQAFQALQTLDKYADPNRHYPLLVALGLDGATPAQTADHLQRLWDQLGYGIPECTPDGCDTTQASGLRTFAFGTLETLLGYRFGQTARRPYSDAAAAATIAAQIGADGIIHAPSQTFLRPAQAGAYPIHFNEDHQFTPLNGASQAISDLLSMPPEYTGLIVSDSETTFDGWAFLITYRCARFKVGCAEIPDAAPPPTP